ncbi:MAG TPA: glutathione S-transferase family protein [Casimicrobiaceae bacterium]|jgi:glutathione S-transferase
MYTLYIGNKNYSSWSARGWLVAKLSGAPFREVGVQLVGRGPNPANRSFSPSGLVPSLHDGDTVVWDSLAIAEYLAERHAGMWPAEASARALARSVTAEMHSGFGALRSEMSMCIRERVDVRPWSAALQGDIDRITQLWTEARTRFGGAGEFLFGSFSIADCFYAPVVFRFQTYLVEPPGAAGDYMRAMLSHPWVREWQDAAVAEKTVIEADEPRVIYRDKLATRAA